MAIQSFFVAQSTTNAHKERPDDVTGHWNGGHKTVNDDVWLCHGDLKLTFLCVKGRVASAL
jgi:hypothetical protein